MADKITKTVDNEIAKKDLNGDGHISTEELEMDLEFKRKELRGERQDVQYFDYYSAEIECLCLEVNRKTKKAEFLIPTMVAEMNGWGNYPEFTGYVVEFSRNGEIFKVCDQIKFFNYDKDEYLEKFRVEALNKSSINEGILIPGHLISDTYLKDLGPILRN